MPQYELHIQQTTGWRALLTQAQTCAAEWLSQDVEEHLVGLLYRHVGAEISASDIEQGILHRADRLIGADTADPATVGEQCLLFAGLLPEHAISKGVPVSYFVEVGRNAFREFASRHRSSVNF